MHFSAPMVERNDHAENPVLYYIDKTGSTNTSHTMG
jgi:hypothetical protein